MFAINKGMIFCDPVDQATLLQVRKAISPDWVLSASLMPDAHLGYSLPIGGVVQTKSIVVPSFIGFDIGCGVCAVKTAYSLEEVNDKTDAIYELVNNAIPMGFKRHTVDIPSYTTKGLTNAGRECAYDRGYDSQLGTLGGGNHFIEFCSDELGAVWIVIHSGSRGTGHGIGGHYMKLAKDLSGSSSGGVEGNYGFRIDTQYGREYLQDMEWCLKYALDNRKRMLMVIADVLRDELLGSLDWDSLINKNHNHAEVDGNGFVLHRKGATSAKQGELGVIPGNMRDGSCIVSGLGNVDSLNSCSHGAGRKFSRSKAKKELDLKDFQDQMVGIKANVSQRTLDESPGAYKEFGAVMRQQRNLCEIVSKLESSINWKA